MSTIRPKHVLWTIFILTAAAVLIIGEVLMWRNNFSDAIKIHIASVIFILVLVLIDSAFDNKWPWEKR